MFNLRVFSNNNFFIVNFSIKFFLSNNLKHFLFNYLKKLTH